MPARVVLIALAHQAVMAQGLLYLVDVGAVDEPALPLLDYVRVSSSSGNSTTIASSRIVVGDQPLDDAEELVRHQE